MQLRNPAVFKKPKTAKEATAFCDALRANPIWEFGDYEPEVSKPLWNWAAKTNTGFRQIIDARLALTLRHHGVTHFATANHHLAEQAPTQQGLFFGEGFLEDHTGSIQIGRSSSRPS